MSDSTKNTGGENTGGKNTGGDDLKKGDHVEWNSHGGTAEGTVEKKITSDTHEAKRDVKASKDDPQYLVKSEKSGGEAVHKPDALTKTDEG